MKLNADLGEHEAPACTEALMELVDLANIACGGHGGSEETMERAVRLALENRVEIGAHPGLAADFGRGAAEIDAAGLGQLIVEQVGDLERIAGRLGASVSHLKLHGALYHAVEQSELLALGYVQLVLARYPGLKIVALAGGRVVRLSRELGVGAVPEAFAERGYREDGSLVPRGQPGDVIAEPNVVAERVRSLAENGRVAAGAGVFVAVEAETVCVHSDTPNAVRMARAAREVLGSRA